MADTAILSELAHVRGRLEGIADAVALNPGFDRGVLTQGLRDDAARLERVEALIREKG